MKIYRAQNEKITEIKAGRFFGTNDIAERYLTDNDAIFEIEIEKASFEDVSNYSGDIDAGLVDDDNLEAVGKVDFLEHNWKQNGSTGETYLSTKNIVLSEICENGEFEDEYGDKYKVLTCKGNLKEVSIEEIKQYCSESDYNKR
jgi:hypothetical protein